MPPPQEPLSEILSRTRRIETRLTAFIESQGVQTKGQKPEYLHGRLQIPTPNCSIKECLDAIPAEARNQTVHVYVGSEHVTSIVP